MFGYVRFVLNGHTDGTSDHHGVNDRFKRTFFDYLLVTVHPASDVSRSWDHADNSAQMLKKTKKKRKVASVETEKGWSRRGVDTQTCVGLRCGVLR